MGLMELPQVACLDLDLADWSHGLSNFSSSSWLSSLGDLFSEFLSDLIEDKIEERRHHFEWSDWRLDWRMLERWHHFGSPEYQIEERQHHSVSHGLKSLKSRLLRKKKSDRWQWRVRWEWEKTKTRREKNIIKY